MKRKRLLLLVGLTIAGSFAACNKKTSVSVNVQTPVNTQKEQSRYEETSVMLGTDTLIEIGGNLWYDPTTKIVYWWNGAINNNSVSTTPSPYYAPNGLPYKYNPETNTFEEIEISCKNERRIEDKE